MKLNDELRKRLEYFRGIGGSVNFSREPHAQYGNFFYASAELGEEIEFGMGAALDEAVAEALDKLKDATKRDI